MYIAFVTGLVSSLHCLGMCGPIALALPARNRLNAVLYNLGRVSTYAALGAVFGLFGRGLYLAGLQQYLSVAAGVCILLVLLVPHVRLPFTARFTVCVRHKFAPFFRQKTAFGVYMIGVLNGLLPCGMVYVALVGAVAMSGLGEGAAYMVLFGLGTLPMMLAVSFSKKLVKPRFKLQINRFMPVLVLCIGTLFIVRGLNLGIPGLSPKAEAQGKTMRCCKRQAD